MHNLVLDLAAFPKVQMKIAGLSHFATDGPLYLSARPFTRRVIAESLSPADAVRLVDRSISDLGRQLN